MLGNGSFEDYVGPRCQTTISPQQFSNAMVGARAYGALSLSIESTTACRGRAAHGVASVNLRVRGTSGGSGITLAAKPRMMEGHADRLRGYGRKGRVQGVCVRSGWLKIGVSDRYDRFGTEVGRRWIVRESWRPFSGSFVAPRSSPWLSLEPVGVSSSGCFVAFLDGLELERVETGFRVAVVDLRAGAVARLTFAGATPGRRVVAGFSLAGPGPTTTTMGRCGPVTLGMSPPMHWLATVAVDLDGNAIAELPVPAHLAGASIWIQAVDSGTCALSNVVATTIG